VKRDDFLCQKVEPIELKTEMTVNELIEEFGKSQSFGAGRVSTACDVFERMVRDKNCTICLALAGAVVPAGLRAVIADLIRKRFIDVLVSTGANVFHDLIEALGGHHYVGHWSVDDFTLRKYHVFRIYDIFVPEEDFVKADAKLVEIFDEVAEESRGNTLSTNELIWKIGSRIADPKSIVRAAYDAKVPVFLPAIRDSEFNYVYWLHSMRQPASQPLKIDSFKEVQEFVDIVERSVRLGMVVLGGGVPRNTIQHIAATTRRGLDYAVVITMDRPETGGLSGSTLEETISWGKLKKTAENVMVIGDVMVIFPMMVAAVLERLGKDFIRRERSNQ